MSHVTCYLFITFLSKIKQIEFHNNIHILEDSYLLKFVHIRYNLRFHETCVPYMVLELEYDIMAPPNNEKPSPTLFDVININDISSYPVSQNTDISEVYPNTSTIHP